MEIFMIEYYITEFEKRNKFFEKNEMYKARKETIERVFADAKEQRGLRYTRYTGLAQVTNWVKLKFAAMNLKKYAKWVWRDRYPDRFSCIISLVSHFSEQTPVLFDAELGFVDTLWGTANIRSAPIKYFSKFLILPAFPRRFPPRHASAPPPEPLPG